MLHLLLNDDPYKGKPLYIKTFAGRMRTIECGPDFYIADVKEELRYAKRALHRPLKSPKSPIKEPYTIH